MCVLKLEEEKLKGTIVRSLYHTWNSMIPLEGTLWCQRCLLQTTM